MNNDPVNVPLGPPRLITLIIAQTIKKVKMFKKTNRGEKSLCFL